MRTNQANIRLAQTRGDLTVTRAVLEQLVAHEALRTPGVVHLGPPRAGRSPGVTRLLRVVGDLVGGLLAVLLGPLAERLRSVPPVSVELGEGEVAVEVSLVAQHGIDLTAMAGSLRDRVTRAVQGMTGLEVRCLDVAVLGLRFDAPQARRLPVDAAAEARRRFMPESV